MTPPEQPVEPVAPDERPDQRPDQRPDERGDQRPDAQPDERPGDDRATRLLGSLREGWHGLAGGDAAACPGCPVCALTHQAGRLDPATTEHLQAAVTHLTSAGRELLALLGARAVPAGPPAATDPGPRRADPEPSRADPEPPRADPDGVPGPVWTRIPVESTGTGTTRTTDEEHP